MIFNSVGGMCHRIESDANRIENKLGIGNESVCSRSPANQKVILFSFESSVLLIYKTYATHYL